MRQKNQVYAKSCHIAYCGPISLDLLTLFVSGDPQLPSGYTYPLGAFLVKEYLDRGHRVSVVTSAFNFAQPTYWQQGNLDIYISPRRHPKYQILDFYRAERKWLREHLSQANPDVIHAQWNYEFAHAALRSGYPYLVTCRDDPWTIFRHVRHPYRLFRAIYGAWLLPKLANVSAISPYLAESLAKGYRLKHSPEIIPNGLSDALIASKPKTMPSGGPIKMISVTGWDDRKNPKLLIKAFAEARASNPRLTLDLIGDQMGPGQKAEAWSRSENATDGIHYLGRKPHGEVLERIRVAQLFVHSTLEESFCMTVLEAIAQGVPAIVLPNSGAVPWLLDNGHAGSVAEAQTASALSDAILLMSSDPARYAELSAVGIQRANEHFRMSVVAGQYLNCLSKLAGNEFER